MDESHGVAEEVSIPSIGRAVRYHEHGEPGSVLKLEEIPVPEIGGGEVLIQMQATTIHPSDLGLINGSYGRLRELPAVGGREGVGTVVSVGSGVDEKSSVAQSPCPMIKGLGRIAPRRGPMT